MVRLFSGNEKKQPEEQRVIKSVHPVEKSALVILDPQKYFINENTAEIPQNLARLLSANIFPLYRISQFINLPGSNFEVNLNWSRMQHEPEIEFDDILKVFAQGHTIIKNGYSVFNDDFENFLKTNQVSTLYFAGFDTEVCVLFNATLAFEKGYKVFVLTNYCASHSGKSEHLAALMVLRRIIGQKGLVDAYFE